MRYLITASHEGSIDEENVPQGLHEGMGALVEKLAADGILVDAGGLERLDKATRVSLSDGEVKVVDGPFSEAKEWIGGYFILQVRSHAEAVEYAKQSIELHQKHVPHMSVSHEVRRIEEA
jgi:hypothetical protein